MSQIISHVLEVGEIKIKMPPDLVPDENSPAHLQMTFLSLHMVEKERDLLSTFIRPPILLDLGPALITSFNFSYFLTDSSSNIVT